jgi:hypothetical protein
MRFCFRIDNILILEYEFKFLKMTFTMYKIKKADARDMPQPVESE